MNKKIKKEVGRLGVVMSEQIVPIVPEVQLREVTQTFKKRDPEVKARVAPILKGLFNYARPHKCIPEGTDLNALRPEFPQFNPVIDFVQSKVIFSRKLGRPFHLSPILLLGDAGLGKTYFASLLAKHLSLPYFEISLATATANFAISGSSMQWGNGSPGFIIESLAKCTVPNPVFLVDEIDKATSGDRFNPITPFYQLLEPHSAERFKDESLNLEVNARHIIWIATANERDRIPAPILSRFKTFHIKQPSPADMHGVINSVYTMLRKRDQLEELLSPHLAEDVRDQLSHLSPRAVRIALEEAITTAIYNDRLDVIVSDLPKIEDQGEHRVGFV